MKNAPTAVRYCKRCGVKTEFASSGLFRVNAQQKNLDVWLIYKCAVCSTTWNLTVLSRSPAHSIPPALLSGFHGNDYSLAMRYAADAALIKRNGAEPRQPEIDMDGEEIELSEDLRIRIIPEQPLEIKAEAVFRKKSGLSRVELDKLMSNERLVCISGHDFRKCKLSDEVVVEIRQE